VASSYPYFPYIQKLADLLLIPVYWDGTSGCGPYAFCPDNIELRQEFAVLLMRALFNETLP